MKTPIVLGIETSCDETAAAVVTCTAQGRGVILAEKLYSQIKDHEAYGGVVPEIAARAHVVTLDKLIQQSLQEAHKTLQDIDAIAVTSGPGLMGGLLTGLTTARALSLACGIPLFAINHLEGHALTVRLTHAIAFPYLLLLVSGGHTQIILVEGLDAYQEMGTTLDDAAGECFDKVARILGLGHPGGPAIEKAAKKGNASALRLPRPMRGRVGCDFSFAGLKTAVQLHVKAQQKIPQDDFMEEKKILLPSQQRADIACAFQQAVGDCLTDRLQNAITMVQQQSVPAPRCLVMAGGVASNQFLRRALITTATRNKMKAVLPPARLCTDNAAMIAWAGLERIRQHKPPTPLNSPARPRWPLQDLTKQALAEKSP